MSTKGFIYEGVERRNQERQVRKNQKDIADIDKSLNDGTFQKKINWGPGLSYDEKANTLSAELNAVIDDQLDSESTNPVQNKVITEALNVENTRISAVETRTINLENGLAAIETDKADDFIVGEGLSMNSNRVLKNTRPNTYPIRVYNTGLQIASPSSETEGDIRQRIYVPYVSQNQAGIVTYNLLVNLISQAVGNNYYLKTETYSQAQVNDLLNAKADKTNTYTKTEVDTELAKKINTSDIATVITSSSTDEVVASGKAVYDEVQEKIKGIKNVAGLNFEYGSIPTVSLDGLVSYLLGSDVNVNSAWCYIRKFTVAPSGANQYGFLEVFRRDTTFCMMRYTDYQNGSTYVRMKQENNWGNWKQIG